MPSVEPLRLTDHLWLAAHDSVNGKPRIGEWPLGLGLATGLLGELIHDGCLELQNGALFRTGGGRCEDPALWLLLDKMAAEERTWLSPAAPSSHPHTEQYVPGGWKQPVPGISDWPAQTFGSGAAQRDSNSAREWPVVPTGDHPVQPPHQSSQHRRRGHELRTWMSYLAYEGRAESRVVDRLSRLGLVRQQERRRLLGSSTVRYVPCNSVVAGSPASLIRIAIQNGRGLDRSQLLLAGLFLATGLHHHALSSLTPPQRSHLADDLRRNLDVMTRELLLAADAAIGEAAMR